jgi:hypothetical protein
MYTFLLLFINNHTQQGFRIERVIILGGGGNCITATSIWSIHTKYWFHRTSNICSLFHKIISNVNFNPFTRLGLFTRYWLWSTRVHLWCVGCSCCLLVFSFLCSVFVNHAWPCYFNFLQSFSHFILIYYFWSRRGTIWIHFIYKYNLCRHTC